MFGVSAVGALALTVAFALPAGANNIGYQPPAFSYIYGVGSATTYYAMQNLDRIFNDAPGCQLSENSSSETQPLDQECVLSGGNSGSVIEGYPALAPNYNAAYTENPVNDVAVEAAQIGSGNGVLALTNDGAVAPATAPVPVENLSNFARSSSNITALGSKAVSGLNFVAYATDGISWFHFTSVGGSATPSSAVTNLTKAQIQGIYNGDYDNWSQLGGANAPILVYSAQEGSGTQSTWKAYLGFDESASTNPVNCVNPSTNPGSTPGTTCNGPEVIFENEDYQIGSTPDVTQGPTLQVGAQNYGNSQTPGGQTTAQIQAAQADAVFFFSFGRYSTNKTDQVNTALGQIAGATINEASILEGTWPVDRFIFNVYSNGTSANFPEATAATINYVSEEGFICKPHTLDQDSGNPLVLPKKVTTPNSNTIVDPITGQWYEQEIQTAIESAGFFPLTSGNAAGKVTDAPQSEGSVDHGALGLLQATNNVNNPGVAQYGEIYMNLVNNGSSPYTWSVQDTGLNYATHDASVVPASGIITGSGKKAVTGVPGQPMGFCQVTSTN